MNVGKRKVIFKAKRRICLGSVYKRSNAHRRRRDANMDTKVFRFSEELVTVRDGENALEDGINERLSHYFRGKKRCWLGGFERRRWMDRSIDHAVLKILVNRWLAKGTSPTSMRPKKPSHTHLLVVIPLSDAISGLAMPQPMQKLSS